MARTADKPGGHMNTTTPSADKAFMDLAHHVLRLAHELEQPQLAAETIAFLPTTFLREWATNIANDVGFVARRSEETGHYIVSHALAGTSRALSVNG
jgi:hypothetical protein